MKLESDYPEGLESLYEQATKEIYVVIENGKLTVRTDAGGKSAGLTIRDSVNMPLADFVQHLSGVIAAVRHHVIYTLMGSKKGNPTGGIAMMRHGKCGQWQQLAIPDDATRYFCFECKSFHDVSEFEVHSK